VSIFYFKKFSIKQDKTAMKVGTDSILLGAWMKMDHTYNEILDVGTGTGLIALMMAQKKPDAKITAIEIDEDAYKQAKKNAKVSVWKDQINVVLTDAKTWESESKFDLVIANPPYFDKSILSKNQNRQKARHQAHFSTDDLLELWDKYGKQKSDLACVLPISESLKVVDKISQKGCFIKDYSIVKSFENQPGKRALLLISKKESVRTDSEICIYAAEGQYSKEYIELTKDFYLHF
jgi:tRNA1Val (adenine37-N6)-methyltransferase